MCGYYFNLWYHCSGRSWNLRQKAIYKNGWNRPLIPLLHLFQTFWIEINWTNFFFKNCNQKIPFESASKLSLRRLLCLSFCVYCLTTLLSVCISSTTCLYTLFFTLRTISLSRMTRFGKFSHFGKMFEVLGHFWKLKYYLAKSWTYFGEIIRYANGQNFLVLQGQIL